VRAIHHRRAAGATMRTIASEMALTGPGPRGQHWHASTIKTILDNGPYYRGEIDYWPAILGSRDDRQ
jgi:hypothetical protein